MRTALADRLALSEAIEVVRLMLRGYANGGQQASGSYIGALAQVLAHYPRCVASGAGDLVAGVPSTTKFLPTPADIISWCDPKTQDLREVVERADREHRIASEAASRRMADEKLAADRKLRPTLQQLHEQYGPNWGINTDDEIISAAKREQQRARAEEANDRLRAAEYADAGVEPRYAAPGIPISYALLKLMRAVP